jgi:zinc transporter
MSIPVAIGGAATRAALGAGIPGLVWAYEFDAEGQPRMLPEPVAPSAIESTRERGGWLWLHFSLTDARGCAFIRGLPLPARALDTLLSRDTHANLHLEGATAYGVLADWCHDGDDVQLPQDVKLGQLRFALTDGLIVSARLAPLRSVHSVRRRLSEGARIESAGHMLEAVVEDFAAAASASHVAMAEALDGIEDRVLAESLSDERRDLGLLRRRAVRLHRPLRSLKDVMEQFERRHRERSSHTLLAAAARLTQRLDHLDGEIVALERRAKMLLDEIATKLAEQTNRQLYVLSILNGLFLPATLVFGFFGMNTGGLPLTQESWGTALGLGIGLAASGAVWYVLQRTRK